MSYYPEVNRNELIQGIRQTSDSGILEVLKPHGDRDQELRDHFAGKGSATGVDNENTRIVPLFDPQGCIDLHRRDKRVFSPDQEKFIFSGHGPTNESQEATVRTLRAFKENFGLFSGNVLGSLDWTNVVVAGGAVTTSLLPRSDGDSYETMAPDADIDLFLYGLDHDQAIEKSLGIEKALIDNMKGSGGAPDMLTVRTTNAITIVSNPYKRRVQIVCRLYRSLEEILVGFDVDCSTFAYDGEMVYASPRGIAAFATRINSIDISRRSPSYENRLFKYAKRGFGVFFREMERAEINPSLYLTPKQRGLTKLLFLEAFNNSKVHYTKYRNTVFRNHDSSLKHCELATQQGSTAYKQAKDWGANQDCALKNQAESSAYDTFTIPNRFVEPHIIERFVLEQDQILNKLSHPYDHRHPAFVGRRMKNVIQDCCGKCPNMERRGPYVSGELSFISRNAGRQKDTIGSFNPITADNWTETAFIGSIATLCDAIACGNLAKVEETLTSDPASCNQQDQVGRTPLHLACMCSSPEIVGCLVDRGASLKKRMFDGKTPLHIAAARGDVEIVRALQGSKTPWSPPVDGELDEADIQDPELPRDCLAHSPPGCDTDSDSNTGSASGVGFSPLHLAILHGHVGVVRELVDSFQADINVPLRLDSPGCYNRHFEVSNLDLARVLPDSTDMVSALSVLGYNASPRPVKPIPRSLGEGNEYRPSQQPVSKDGGNVSQLRSLFENPGRPPTEMQDKVLLKKRSDQLPRTETPAINYPQRPPFCSALGSVVDFPETCHEEKLKEQFIGALKRGDVRSVEEIVENNGFPFLDMNNFATLRALVSQDYTGLLVDEKRKPQPESPSVHILDRGQPLHIAVFNNNLDMTKWILSEDPAKCFRKYLKRTMSEDQFRAHTGDGSLFSSDVNTNMRGNVATILHRAVLSQLDWSQAEKLMKYLVEYLVKNNHHPLQKDLNGRTPLAVSFAARNVEAAKTLLSVCGKENTVSFHNDQDNSGNNILHLMLLPVGRRTAINSQEVKSLVGALEGSTVCRMLQEKNRSLHTPLAAWLDRLPDLRGAIFRGTSASHDGGERGLMRLMISLAHKHEISLLDMLGGAGNSSVHGVVRKGQVGVLHEMMNKDGSLFYNEDMTGQTPLELLWELWVITATSQIPEYQGSQKHDAILDIFRTCQELDSKQGDDNQTLRTRRRNLIDLDTANNLAKQLIGLCGDERATPVADRSAL